MPFLDAIPVNVFIFGSSLLAGVILFLIIWQIPEEDKEGETQEAVEKSGPTPSPIKSARKPRKKSSA